MLAPAEVPGQDVAGPGGGERRSRPTKPGGVHEARHHAEQGSGAHTELEPLGVVFLSLVRWPLAVIVASLASNSMAVWERRPSQEMLRVCRNNRSHGQHVCRTVDLLCN